MSCFGKLNQRTPMPCHGWGIRIGGGFEVTSETKGPKGRRKSESPTRLCWSADGGIETSRDMVCTRCCRRTAASKEGNGTNGSSQNQPRNRDSHSRCARLCLDPQSTRVQSGQEKTSLSPNRVSDSSTPLPRRPGRRAQRGWSPVSEGETK